MTCAHNNTFSYTYDNGVVYMNEPYYIDPKDPYAGLADGPNLLRPAGGPGGVLGPQPSDEQMRVYRVIDVLSANAHLQSGICKVDDPTFSFQRCERVAHCFLQASDTKKLLQPCSQANHPKENCPHQFVDYYNRAHVYMHCDRCKCTPLGTLYNCTEQCVPKNIYSLCEECFAESAAHDSCKSDPKFQALETPMCKQQVKELCGWK